MSDPPRLAELLRTKLRAAGQQYETARREYDTGKAETYDLATDGEGNARIVCRRDAEKRAVPVDSKGRPACYEVDHPDCEGCIADIREGTVETWEE